MILLIRALLWQIEPAINLDSVALYLGGGGVYE